MTRKSRRLILIAACGSVLALAVGLILFAMSGSIVFFRSPSDIARQAPAPDRAFRLGGLVETGSVVRETAPDGKPEARFRVTDGAHGVPVTYVGVLPDLFREGQGVVTLGKLGTDGVFRASEVLARHDETYMPPEVADALKKSGHWNPEQGAAPPAREWNTMEPASGAARSGG